jgi:hypothetical protein
MHYCDKKGKKLNLKIIQDVSELGPIWDDINDLVLKYVANIFLTKEWLKTWWECFGANNELLFICALDQNDSLKGFAPLKISKSSFYGLFYYRIVGFIGTGGPSLPDHLQFVSVPEYRKELFHSVINFLHSNFTFYDVISFSSIDGNSKFATEFEQLDLNLQDITIIGEPCPYFSLPVSYQEFLSTKSAKTRRNIKKAKKRIEKEFNVNLHYITKNDEINEAFKVAALLHEKSLMENKKEGSFRKPGFLEFHKRFAKLLLKKGHLIFVILYLDNQPVAFRYGFNLNDKYYDYLTGYDPYYKKWSPGVAIMNYIIADLIRRKTKEYDLLRGGYRYKYHWADKQRASLTKNIYNKSLKGNIIYIHDMIKIIKMKHTKKKNIQN